MGDFVHGRYPRALASRRRDVEEDLAASLLYGFSNSVELAATSVQELRQAEQHAEEERQREACPQTGCRLYVCSVLRKAVSRVGRSFEESTLI